MTKFTKNLIFGSGGVILLLLLGYGTWGNHRPAVAPSSSVPQIEFKTLKAESAYDLIAAEQKEGKMTFTEKDYAGMGAFIDSINGVAGENGKNWIFYVNGQKAEVGVSNYKLKPGDIVTWKYESDY